MPRITDCITTAYRRIFRSDGMEIAFRHRPGVRSGLFRLLNEAYSVGEHTKIESVSLTPDDFYSLCDESGMPVPVDGKAKFCGVDVFIRR